MTCLIQKRGAAVGEFKAPGVILAGAAERALAVAEAFAFKQLGGDGRAVDLDQRALAPFAHFMDSARDQFLLVLAHEANFVEC